MPDLVLWFWILGLILTVGALFSGLIDRSPLSFSLIFLALGALLSDSGAGVISMEAEGVLLEVVATLTLALILFLDAVNLEIDQLGRRLLTPLLIIGPGSALVIGLSAVTLALLLDFPWVIAFIGGAALASTDPAVLREIVRDPRVPRSIRQVLKIEAGTNDVVVLPVVLILIAVAVDEGRSAGAWTAFLLKLLLAGPAIGFAIGGLGSWLMRQIDRRTRARDEHQALFGIGLVLSAYAAATLAGSDGFLAAFAAGLAVVLLNQSMCDCFLEYGEVTAEMATMLAFMLFGAVLAGLFDSVAVGPAIGLAALVLLVFRPTALGAVLSRAHMSWAAKGFVGWFGPRGLNSLLLVLLAVHAGVPGAEVLLGTVGVVVVASVVLHGRRRDRLPGCTPERWLGRPSKKSGRPRLLRLT